MQLSAFVSLVVSATAASAALIASAPLTECLHETVVSSGFIGKDHNVKFETSHCDDAPHFAADGKLTGLDKRAVPSIVCDAPCNTFCFSGAGGGPNEDDCKVVSDALLFESHSTAGPLFNATAAGTPTDKITMQFGSCLTYFLNQSPGNLTYCENDWSTLVTWLAGDCNAAHGAHGGLCVAQDQRWYIQVQNTSG
ncbi:hypothetical protein OH76DRAFT_1423903 [Lentinus brumalis]|uniref:Uncharacterized protein n=1 Tax=Lentinus brumalis TaxID=2498619 RepID=A0A371CIL9_9APHY|nr:hypothetical protein OH76DRAFT_1423903 [Polyporus brumalis]